MELVLAAAALSLAITDVTSLQCYQCHINPPSGHNYTTTERLCANFDASTKFVVDCPHSTFCMKQDIRLDILNGGHYYTTTERLWEFRWIEQVRRRLSSPHSTFCMKQDIRLDIFNGVRVEATLRDCAPQKHSYLDYRNGQWSPKEEILEPYKEGCEDLDSQGQRTTPTRYCYCKSNLCNAAPATNHEGYTDIMGVIVVFNLMKYINSLR